MQKMSAPLPQTESSSNRLQIPLMYDRLPTIKSGLPGCNRRLAHRSAPDNGQSCPYPLSTAEKFECDRPRGWLFPKQTDPKRPIDTFFLYGHIHEHE